MSNISQQPSTSSSASSLLELVNTNVAAGTTTAATNQRSSRSSGVLQGQHVNVSVCNPSLQTTTTTSIKQYHSMEEITNFSNEINTNDSDIVPTYLLANVNFQNINSHAFLVTLNGDIFFLNLAAVNTKKAALWHRNLKTIIINCFKMDINVSWVVFFYLY